MSRIVLTNDSWIYVNECYKSPWSCTNLRKFYVLKDGLFGGHPNYIFGFHKRTKYLLLEGQSFERESWYPKLVGAIFIFIIHKNKFIKRLKKNTWNWLEV